MAQSEDHSPGSSEEPSANTPHKPPESEPEAAVLNQGLVDELIAAQSGQSSALLDTTSLGKEDALSDDSPLVKRDEDDLLAPVSNELLSGDGTDSGGKLSQATLDRLIAEHNQEIGKQEPSEVAKRIQDGARSMLGPGFVQQKPVSSSPPEEGNLSQEDLDRLVSELGVFHDASKVEPQGKAEVLLSQEELDQIVAQSSKAKSTESRAAVPGGDNSGPVDSSQTPPGQVPPPVEEPHKAEALSQSELDRHLAPQTGSGASLDQAALDALLAELQETPAQQTSSGTSTPAPSPDAVADTAGLEGGPPSGSSGSVASGPSEEESLSQAVSLSQSDLDALIAGFDHEGAPPPSGSQEPAALSESITQDMIEALISAASTEESAATAEVGSENLAAAATSPTPVPETTPLEVPVAKPAAQKTAPAPPPQIDMESAVVVAPAPRKTRRSVRRKLPRIGVALAAGLLVGLGTFSALYLNQERAPELPAPAGAVEEAGITLYQAMEQAKAFIAAKEYEKAAAVLEEPMARAKSGEEYTNARFLCLEAHYKGFEYEPDSPKYQELHNEIDALTRDNPAHARTLEALHWKGKLYEMDNMPYAAYDVYKQIIERFAGAPLLDTVLIDSAKLGNGLRNPQEAAEYAQRLLKEYPGSAYASEAHLVLGDAYAMAGMEDDARTLYVRLADNEPGSPRGSEAFLRLGRQAMDQKNYDAAINHLKTCLQTSAAKEGNDKVYLMLAQAYRQKGLVEDARKTLNDLINFFSSAPALSAAMVELSQIAESAGDRKEAMNLAQQAVVRFPKDPLALRNYGEFLGLDGNPYGAAATLMAADEAGANDPMVLIVAARHYRTLTMNEQAREAYAKVKEEYPKSPEALTAAIEEAQVLFMMDKVSGAVEQLQQLAETHAKPEERLPILIALSRVYRDLGLTAAAADISKQIAAESTEPESLAEAAIDVLRTEDLEAAQPIIARVDAAKLSNPMAYGLLTEFGKALLSVDPNRALEKLEAAYLNYPDARKPEDEQVLLEAYIAANRTAAARRMVMERAAETRNAPADTPYLVDAAITWGDYLYGRGDYREAAEAYDMAITAAQVSTFSGKGIKTDPVWAKYQRANALLELADFAGSLTLFKEVAATDSAWAKEAGMKAGYAEIEQRLRGAAASNVSGEIPKEEG
ncbi:MAG TPA: tetratricopeptide repeat protein [Candidatus Hydrogenedentes bacterium]|nr:tetratricopeptide repeat protein [Candidatus Hydrogenedentota bacterium]